MGFGSNECITNLIIFLGKGRGRMDMGGVNACSLDFQKALDFVKHRLFD